MYQMKCIGGIDLFILARAGVTVECGISLHKGTLHLNNNQTFKGHLLCMHTKIMSDFYHLAQNITTYKDESVSICVAVQSHNLAEALTS